MDASYLPSASDVLDQLLRVFGFSRSDVAHVCECRIAVLRGYEGVEGGGAGDLVASRMRRLLGTSYLLSAMIDGEPADFLGTPVLPHGPYRWLDLVKAGREDLILQGSRGQIPVAVVMDTLDGVTGGDWRKSMPPAKTHLRKDASGQTSIVAGMDVFGSDET